LVIPASDLLSMQIENHPGIYGLWILPSAFPRPRARGPPAPSLRTLCMTHLHPVIAAVNPRARDLVKLLPAPGRGSRLPPHPGPRSWLRNYYNSVLL